MKVFLADLLCLHLLLPFFAVTVNKQEQNSFRALNVQNYAPNYRLLMNRWQIQKATQLF